MQITQYSINKIMKIVRRTKARVPERTSLHSFNLLWLMWAVCGGFFITNFLLSNFVATLMKPVFEKPVDNAHVKSKQIQIKLPINIFCRMYLTETSLFTYPLVVNFTGKKCRSYLIHFLSWQKNCTFQALIMSCTILQNMICWKRKVTYILSAKQTYTP